MSSFLGLAGGVLVFHFQTIHDQQDECPIILLYSKSSGTGNVRSFYASAWTVDFTNDLFTSRYYVFVYFW